MKELISEEAFNRIIILLAIIGPILGLAVGVAVSLIRHSGRLDVLRGLAIGSLGIAVWVMWRVYEAVTAQFGLSTTKNLLIQLGIFAGVGIAVGILYTIFCAKPRQTD